MGLDPEPYPGGRLFENLEIELFVEPLDQVVASLDRLEPVVVRLTVGASARLPPEPETIGLRLATRSHRVWCVKVRSQPRKLSPGS